MVGILTPKVVGSVSLDPVQTKYPVDIIGYDKDGNLIGSINESKLTAVQRILLDTMVE